MRRFRSYNADRFPNYSEIVARYASVSSCGHTINKGDIIGHNKGNGKTQCADCWRNWVIENREADLYEANLNW